MQVSRFRLFPTEPAPKWEAANGSSNTQWRSGGESLLNCSQLTSRGERRVPGTCCSGVCWQCADWLIKFPTSVRVLNYRTLRSQQNTPGAPGTAQRLWNIIIICSSKPVPDQKPLPRDNHETPCAVSVCARFRTLSTTLCTLPTHPPEGPW